MNQKMLFHCGGLKRNFYFAAGLLIIMCLLTVTVLSPFCHFVEKAPERTSCSGDALAASGTLRCKTER